MNPEAIGRLRDHAIVYVVNKMPGGGNKKGPRKSNQTDQSATNKSSSEADAIFELMEEGSRTGRRGWNVNVIGKMLELDDEETQDMMRRLRSSIQVSAGLDPEPTLEGLKEAAARTPTGNENLARGSGDRDRTRTTETRGNGERERWNNRSKKKRRKRWTDRLFNQK